jgi:molybdate transport system substrate-binding protein
MSGKLNVLCSGAFIDAFTRLSPLLERTIDAELCVLPGSSVSTKKNAIPMRLRGGEPCDVAILFDEVASELEEEGIIRPGSKRQLASSSIGMAVPQGARRPDISTVRALRETLLDASSIAYSSSQSGVYLSTVLFPKLGITQAIQTKCLRVEAERVGAVVARGDAEIGFQQMSELLSMTGITVVGPLPPDVQRVTVISAGVPVQAANPEAAATLIQRLRSDEARPVLVSVGLDSSNQ